MTSQTDSSYPIVDLSQPAAPQQAIYVRYGSEPHQVMPLAWAEHMLSMLAVERPRVFKDLLGTAALPGQE